MLNFLKIPLILLLLLPFCTSIIDLPSQCSKSFTNKYLQDMCLKKLIRPPPQLYLSTSTNVSKQYYYCLPKGALTINSVVFNGIPALNGSFGVFLNGIVSTGEDLKEVVVVIYMNSAQQNVDTVPKTDVLDAGNLFSFDYNAFIPYYLSKGSYSIQFTVHNVNLENIVCVGVNFTIPAT